MPRLRTLLILGRVSNLPTVWSNCLAGWWLGGGGNADKLTFLVAGTTLLYIGGMFLNDAFDAEFDRQYRKERPVPSGAIQLKTVWQLGLTWLTMGALCLFAAGLQTGLLGIALLVCILAYDSVHKIVVFSPVLMGICRFFVYIVAASTGRDGVTGWAIWSGLALGFYVAGLSFLARRESARGAVSYWPLGLLGIPIVLALLMNAGSYRGPAMLLSLVLALWIARCLRPIFGGQDRQVGRTVSGLLAGIVFVDWLAAADVSRDLSIIFLLLFALAWLFQRVVPAT